MDPTPVIASEHFCFVTRGRFSSPSKFLFSHFPFPFSPVTLPKQKPKPRKSLNLPRLVRTIITSEQHPSLRCVQRRDLLRHDPFPSDADEETQTHKNFSSFLASSGPSPVNNTQLSDVYSGTISSVVTHFPVAPTSNNNNVTHFPILSRTISSDPRRCFPPSLSSAQPIICLLPLLMSPLLVTICAIWIGVWKGPLCLSVISVGGSMDVSSGRWTLISHVSSSNGWTRTYAHVAVQ